MRLTLDSLLARITGAVGVAAALLLALGAWMINDRIAATVAGMHAVELGAVATSLGERLARGGADWPAALPDGIVFAALDEDGAVRAASPGAEPTLPRRDLLDEPEARFRVTEGGRRYWGISRRIEAPDGPVVLQLAQDMSGDFVLLDDVPRAALGPILALVASGGLLLVGASFVSVRRLLAPLRRAAAEAAAIGPADRRRIGLAGAPREAMPLIRAVNSAVDRLAEALERQRAFSREVAHELRTPLAIMQAEVELLDDRGLAARLGRDLDQLKRLINQLLELAEAEGQVAPPSPGAADLAAVAAEVVDRLGGLAARSGCGLALVGAERPVWAEGDPEALGRALRNLVENALVHTAPGSAVEVRLRAPATVEVADRGPGVPEALRPRIFEEFWRGRRDGAGAGLGLAIVRRIAEGCGGSVAVADNPGGGALFSLRLRPLEPATRRLAPHRPDCA